MLQLCRGFSMWFDTLKHEASWVTNEQKSRNYVCACLCYSQPGPTMTGLQSFSSNRICPCLLNRAVRPAAHVAQLFRVKKVSKWSQEVKM